MSDDSDLPTNLAPSPSPTSPRAGSIGLGKLLLTLILALLGFLGFQIPRQHVGPPLPERAAMPPSLGDTLFYFGPEERTGAAGAGNVYVDEVRIKIEPGTIYRLVVQNGTAGGANRVTSAVTKWNGDTLIRSADLGTGTYQVERVLGPAETDTLVMRVVGTSGSYVHVSVVALPSPEFAIFGDSTYRIAYGDTMGVFYSSFTKPTSGPPYRLYIINGDPDGFDRVHSGLIKINGTTVVAAAELGLTTASLMREVSIADGLDSLRIEIHGDSGNFVTLRITGTDTTPPVIAVTLPVADSIVIAEDSVEVLGTVEDETPADVFVNGSPTDNSEGEWSGRIYLPTEGWNTLRFTARNGAGDSTVVIRHVMRDTEGPVLTIDEPADSTYTRDDSITVSAHWTDLQDLVEAYVNGVYLEPKGNTGSARLPLDIGREILVTTATDSVGHETVDVRTVFRDTLPPILVVSAPEYDDSTAADSITVSGTVNDDSPATLTVNGISTQIKGDEFSRKIPLSLGPNTITVIATDAAANDSTIVRTVFRMSSDSLPPDPATVAPALSQAVATTAYSASRFLYTGDNPIQTGVDSGTINVRRAAILRGTVVDTAGAALSGATISILNHTELGQTLSRADGEFDMAVNGGGQLVVQVKKAGYPAVQRSIEVPWQDWVVLDTVSMTPLSSRSTQINFTNPIEVARGDSVTDTAGTRQVRLMFQESTQVSVTLPNGSPQNLTGPIHVRATEYTVGERGPARMPGTLPASSVYTYAAELSVDEADSLGATAVHFDKPVSFYLDGFIDVPVGFAVPFGTYDRQSGKWVPEPDARVIKILSVTSGKANLQIDTVTNHAASAGALDTLGFTNDELTQLATEYPVGKVLWRSQHTHFSPGDWNLILFLDAAARAAVRLGHHIGELVDRPTCRGGSVIGCENQTLGEAVPITGTPFALHYQSERAPGFTAESFLDLQITEDTIPASAIGALLRFTVAGKTQRRAYVDSAGLRDTISWNGLDRYDRPMQGRQIATVDRCYVFPILAWGNLGGGGGGGGTFGMRGVTGAGGGETVFLPSGREGFTSGLFCFTVKFPLGAWSSGGQGLGGWSLSPVHAYDPLTQTLYQGNGQRRGAVPLGNIIRTMAGVNDTGFAGDSGLATAAKLYSPTGVALDQRGNLYIANSGRPRISRVDSAGVITTVAGDGSLCAPATVPACGDGGVATSAKLRFPSDIAVGPDGSLYIADHGDARVRRVAPDGTISTIAGTGTQGYTGDGGPATSARLHSPNGVAVGPDGSIYIADGGNATIRRVDPKGMISTFAGTGTVAFYGGNGEPAAEVGLGVPQKIVVKPDGTVYFSDSYHRVVRQVSIGGIISTVAGNNGFCVNDLFDQCGDNGPATGAELTGSSGTFDLGLALGPDGSLYIAAADLYRIRRVDPKGIITTVVGSGVPACSVGSAPAGCISQDGDGGIAQQAAMHGTYGVAVGPDGSLYLAEFAGQRVRRVAPALPGLQTTDMLVASEDGSVVYQFGATGIHNKTRDALTGATLLTISYDSLGRVDSLVDALGNVTRVERTGGQPTAIVAPFGQRTALTTNGNGYLSQISNPGGERVKLFSRANGLLDSLADPKGQVHRFTFDAQGRLTNDTDPAGRESDLVMTISDTSRQVAIASAMGRTTTHLVKPSESGLFRQITDPAGLVTTSQENYSGTTTTTTPDSTLVTSVEGADPRYGMQAPMLKSLTVRLPSGLTSTVTGIRRDSLTDPINPFSLVTQTDSVSLNGKWTRSVYTAATRRVVQTSPVGRQVFSTLDTLGRVVSVQVDGLDSVRFVYDNKGRLSQESDGGRTTTYLYNSTSGRLDSLLDPLNRRTGFTYDSGGRVKTQKLPDGRIIAFVYDSNGNLTSLTPPSRPAHGFQYTAGDLARQYDPPLLPGNVAKPTKYFYNLDRQVDSIVRPDSLSIRFKYDAAGRPDSVLFDRGALRFGYSGTTGNLTSIRAPGNDSLKFTYDGSLPTSVSWKGSVTGSVAIKYNSDFRVDSQFVNGANGVKFTYDNDGLLTQAGGLKLGRSSNNGLLMADTLGPMRTAYSYTSRGELKGYQVKRSSTVLFGVGYVRDSLGRITQMFDTTQGTPKRWSYVYDGVGRLITDSVDGVLSHGFTYDSNGNRLTYSVNGGGTVNYTYDNQDRLLTAGSTTYSYTSNGELTRKIAGSDTTRYTYDVFGNLVKVILPNHDSLEYLIDGQNRRVGRKFNGAVTNRWLYQNQLNPVAELDSAGNVVSRFVYGGRMNVPDYMIKSGSVYRLITDHLGSVRLVVDTATGAVAQWTKYDEWGMVTADSGAGFQPFGFAGGIEDIVTGAVRFGWRDYDPTAGRWMSKDPLGLLGAGTGTYVYCEQDPIQMIDPSGGDPVGIASAGVNGIVHALLIEGQAGVSFGITTDGQIFVQGQLGAGLGLGLFAGVGAQGGATISDGPLRTGFSVSGEGQINANIGYGATEGVTISGAPGSIGGSRGILPRFGGGGGIQVSIGGAVNFTYATPPLRDLLRDLLGRILLRYLRSLPVTLDEPGPLCMVP